MLTIGYSNKYYTLWEVDDVYEDRHYYNNICIGITYKQDCTYYKNLSLDKAKAIQKVEAMNVPYEINENLRGHSFTRDIRYEEIPMPDTVFPFGKTKGELIAECGDYFFLDRAYTEDKSARRRMIELGMLVKFPYHKKKYISYSYEKDEHETIDVNQNYWTPSQVSDIKTKLHNESFEKGHFFTEGEKVTLELKEIVCKSFQNKFGTSYICIYHSKCGKEFKYLGSAPASIPSDKFVTIQATIKHDMYEGKPETKLLRVKIK